MTTKYTYFISDTHLGPGQDAANAKFFAFIEKINNPDTDALYILGDCFDRWLGDDDYNDIHGKVKKALATLTKNHIPVYYQLGNHDFLLGHRFRQLTGALKLPDPFVLELYDQKILLSHGDIFCTDDLAYQKMRKIFHNSIVQTLFLLLPLWLRRKIAHKIQHKNTSAKQEKTLDIMDVNQTAIVNAMNYYQTDIMIHGHTHRPAEHGVELNGKKGKRFVLGSWLHDGEYLAISEQAIMHQKM